MVTLLATLYLVPAAPLVAAPAMPAMSVEERALAGEIGVGRDQVGNFFVAVSDRGPVARLFTVQFGDSDPATLDSGSQVFEGTVVARGRSLRIVSVDGTISLGFYLSDASEEGARLGKSIENVYPCVGIAESTVARAAAPNVATFLKRAASTHAQLALRGRPPVDDPSIIFNPDPGGGGWGGGAACSSGGPGSTSCSISGSSDSCSVTCEAGYYACCVRRAIQDNVCSCIKK